MKKRLHAQLSTSLPLTQRIEFPDADFKIFVSERQPPMQSQALHEEIEIKLFLEGESAQMIDKTVYLPLPGDITVVNPYEIHSNVSPERYNGRYLLLLIDVDFLKSARLQELDLRQQMIDRGRKIQHRIEKDERLSRILWRIAEEIREGKGQYRTAVRCLVGELFVLLLRDYLEGGATSDERHDRRGRSLISPALTRIHADYGEALTLEQLADTCNLSTSYFSHLFKQMMKVSAIEYLNRYRMDIAEVLLREGSCSIDAVAEICGIHDMSYFYRCYRRYKEESPGKTREKGMQRRR